MVVPEAAALALGTQADLLGISRRHRRRKWP